MRLYNLFPRLAGRMQDWEPHFERIRAMGFDWVFVNSLQYPGFSGSLYSVSDYFSWNPDFLDSASRENPTQQVRAAIQSKHCEGLKIMTDLVVNHCAFDSPLIQKHPEWFEWESGLIVHPGCDENGKRITWGDLAKFHYHDNPELPSLVQYWMSVIEHLVDTGFVGFRCDAAYQVPVAVWQELIEGTRRRWPHVVFVAESLGCTPEETRGLASVGFDFVFNSSHWWDFRAPWLLEQYDALRNTVPSISFPESHDTERRAASLDGNVAGLQMWYLFSALFSSGVMMPVGYEFAFRKKLNVVQTRPTDWEAPSADLVEYITSVNRLKAANALFQREVETSFVASGNPEVLVMRKRDEVSGEAALVILNTDVTQHQEFSCDNLYDYVTPHLRLHDVSPEYRLEYLPTPFQYALRPGQGIVLVTHNARNGG